MTTVSELVLGSRESPLALIQSYHVINSLKARYPNLNISLKTYKTQGDIHLDSTLAKIGGKGLFVKELQVALLEGEIDFAVHSMKDMPSTSPPGLYLLPFGPRETPFDALVSRAGQAFQALAPGAVVGTSSLRRQAVLRNARPDLTFEIVRGNVQTRLKKLDEGHYDALILAAAGLIRLNLQDRITQGFSAEDILPACCQGTLAVEFAKPELRSFFEPLLDPVTAICTHAERGFLKALDGGCQLPMAAYANLLTENTYQLKGMLCSVDGLRMMMHTQTFLPPEAENTGRAVAETLLNQGGREILEALSMPQPINHP
jgi:hydroxymethylbilane synthase